MTKSSKSDRLSLITPIEPDFEALLGAMEDDAKLAVAANEAVSSFDDIMEMVGGKRVIPFCVNMSAATADRLVNTRWAA